MRRHGVPVIVMIDQFLLFLLRL